MPPRKKEQRTGSFVCCIDIHKDAPVQEHASKKVPTFLDKANLKAVEVQTLNKDIGWKSPSDEEGKCLQEGACFLVRVSLG